MNNNSPIITSPILSQFNNVIHGMSTKIGGCENPPYYNNLSYKVGDDANQVKANREIFFGSLGIDSESLAIPKQVHSAKIQIINSPGMYPDTDALITLTKNVFLIVSIADCFPILIYEKTNHVVGIVHSGWRGTQKQILKQTINKMISNLGCNADSMYFFIGPGISKDSFEIGVEVAKLFDTKYCERRNEKFYLDLKANLLDQILSFNVPLENININGLCTYKENDYLHSFRRDKDKSGRMMAVIGIK